MEEVVSNNQDNPQIVQTPNLDKMNNFKVSKGNYLVIIAVVLLIVLLVAGFSLFVLISSRQQTKEINPSATQPPITELKKTPEESPSTPLNSAIEAESKILAKYNSPDEKYTLSFYSGEINEIGTLVRCRFSLTERTTNEEVVIKSYFSTQLIRCDSGLGNFSSDFIQWAKHILVINDNETSQVKLVDIDNKKALTHQYDGSSLAFLGVDNTLTYWLYYDKYSYANSNDKITYILLDTNGKQINKKTINSEEKYTARTIYDPKNNGFLFIYPRLNKEATEKATNQGENIGNGLYQYFFDFFSIDKLKEINLLTTDPYPIFGRGCYKENIVFQEGKIIIDSNNGSCLQIDEKYYSGGNIILEVK